MAIDDFSVDHQAEQIFDKRTKVYFDEVNSSYVNGNYRSAVVMLWSVVVCDLVFKLQHLTEIYTDTTAEAILNEMADMQTAQPNSPAWEAALVEKVTERTGILDVADKAALDHIRAQRHLAAHPIIRGDSELHRPNKDDVRAMMRAALESVLTKLPLVSRQVTGQLLEDVAESQALFIFDGDLSRYLESKYFTRFTAGVAAAVFKTIWKLVFRTENPECNQNRAINWRVLRIIANKDRNIVPGWIASDSSYYSNISNNEEILQHLVKFLAYDRRLYEQLEVHAKTTAQQYAATNAEATLFGWYFYPTREDHAAAFEVFCQGLFPIIRVGDEAWTAMRSISSEPDWNSRVRCLANMYYAYSRSFDGADGRFCNAISPDLDNYSIADLRDLMARANGNGQCYNRGRASTDHRFVRDKVRALDPEFDFSPYEHFLSGIIEE